MKRNDIPSSERTPNMHPLLVRLLFVFLWGPEWLLKWGLKMHQSDVCIANDNSPWSNAAWHESHTTCVECGARREFTDWRVEDQPRRIDIFALH